MTNTSLSDARIFAPKDFERWAIGGVLLNFAGYLTMVIAGWWQMGYTGVTSNLVATVVCGVALLVAIRGHGVAAALLAVLTTWAETQYGFLFASTFPEAGLLVLPVLVIAIGLLLGTRRALVATLLTIVASVAAFANSPAAQPGGLTRPMTYWLELYAVVLICAWGLIALTLRGYGRVMRELSANQRDLADTIHSSPDGILVVDGTDTVLIGNPSAQQLLGVPEAQLIGRRVTDVLSAALGSTASAAVMARPSRERHPLQLTDSDGATRHLEVTWRLMTGDRRQLVLHDLSDRVRAEEQRRAIEAQLAHAQRMEAVGQLAGGLSHDFNNILTAVGGSADLLRGESRPAERLALIDDIIAARDRGAALTRQLLAFARRDVVSARLIDLATHVRSLERLLQRVASERTRLRLVLESDCTVRLDVGQLEQALVNLVSNARDAMPQGGTCTITLRRVEREGGPVARLTIADDGMGMKPAVAARAFEPFFTTKPRGQGTGLGLASVHALAGQGGGTAAIESQPGKGTSVSIELPLVAGVPDPAEPGTLEAPAVGERATILVAEDDPGTRTIVQRILERAGHEVLVAHDGVEALVVLEDPHRHVDLLLTDVMMPRLTGPALAARARALRPRLPVLFMTGYAEDTVRDLGHVRFDRDVITKPFSGNALLGRIEELLRVSVRPGGTTRST